MPNSICPDQSTSHPQLSECPVTHAASNRLSSFTVSPEPHSRELASRLKFKWPPATHAALTSLPPFTVGATQNLLAWPAIWFEYKLGEYSVANYQALAHAEIRRRAGASASQTSKAELDAFLKTNPVMQNATRSEMVDSSVHHPYKEETRNRPTIVMLYRNNIKKLLKKSKGNVAIMLQSFESNINELVKNREKKEKENILRKLNENINNAVEKFEGEIETELKKIEGNIKSESIIPARNIKSLLKSLQAEAEDKLTEFQSEEIPTAMKKIIDALLEVDDLLKLRSNEQDNSERSKAKVSCETDHSTSQVNAETSTDSNNNGAEKTIQEIFKKAREHLDQCFRMAV